MKALGQDCSFCDEPRHLMSMLVMALLVALMCGWQVAAGQTITISSLTPTTVCAGSDVTIVFTVSAEFTGTSSYTAQLSGSNGNFPPATDLANVSQTQAANTVSKVVSIPGGASNSDLYRIRIVSTDPTDTSTNSVTVQVRTAPTAGVGDIQTICSGGTTNALGGVATPATANGNWSIVSGGTGTFNAPTSGSSTFTHTGGNGPVILQWLVSNAPCSQESDQVSITVLPQVNFGSIALNNPSICHNTIPTTITVAGTSGGSGNFTYQWYQFNGIPASCPTGDTIPTNWSPVGTPSANPIFTPSALTSSTTYACFVTSAASGDNPACGGQWATGCRQITVLPAYSNGTLAGNDTTVCNGTNPGTFSFSLPPTGSGSFTYQWYRAETNLPCPATFPPPTPWELAGSSQALSPGNLSTTTTFACYVTPGPNPTCGIPGWASGCRVVNVLPQLSYGTLQSLDTSICAGSPIQVPTITNSPQGSGSFAYQWYRRAGASAACPAENSSTNGWEAHGPLGLSLNQINLTESTTFALRVSPSGTPDCGEERWMTGCLRYTVNQAATAVITPPDSSCGIAPVGLTVSANNSGFWSDSGAPGAFADSTDTSTNYTPSTSQVGAGQITITWTTLGLAPCPDVTASTTIIANPQPTIPDFTFIDDNTEFCIGEYTNWQVTNNALQPPGTTYEWTAANSSAIGGSSGLAHVRLWESANTSTYLYVTAAIGPCTATDSIEVSVSSELASCPKGIIYFEPHGLALIDPAASYFQWHDGSTLLPVPGAIHQSYFNSAALTNLADSIPESPPFIVKSSINGETCWTHTIAWLTNESLGRDCLVDPVSWPPSLPKGHSVYPNPVEGKSLTIEALGKPLDEALICELYDAHGRLVHAERVQVQPIGQLAQDLTGFQRGFYVLRLRGNGTEEQFKLILN